MLDKEILNVDNIKEWNDNLFSRYATFKVFYQGLCFDTTTFSGHLDPLADYDAYINKKFRADKSKGELMNYSQLPVFYNDLQYYSVLESMVKIKNQILDKENSEKYKEKERLRRNFNDTVVFKSAESQWNHNCSVYDKLASDVLDLRIKKVNGLYDVSRK